jgi:predicted O-methyltransferase YrrM
MENASQNLTTNRIIKDTSYKFHQSQYIVKQYNLTKALAKVTVTGKYLEFGVWRGDSINFIAERVQPHTVFGFDSWQGLPEEWSTPFGVYPPGTFSTNNQLPEVADNVQLVSGLFEDTLPDFCASHNEATAFVHIDSDLYSSAKTIFKYVGPSFVDGTIIVFDDWLWDPNSEERAFREWLAESNNYATLLFSNDWQATFVIKSRK